VASDAEMLSDGFCEMQLFDFRSLGELVARFALVGFAQDYCSRVLTTEQGSVILRTVSLTPD
jgi:hypothetical protein